MFSQKKRLSRSSFPIILTTGQRLSSPHLTAIISKEVKGYAVVLPKKTTRLSSIRHQIKRRVSAALKTLPLPPALIIFPKTSAHSVSYKDIRLEIITMLSKIKKDHNN